MSFLWLSSFALLNQWAKHPVRYDLSETVDLLLLARAVKSNVDFLSCLPDSCGWDLDDAVDLLDGVHHVPDDLICRQHLNIVIEC